MTGGRYEVRVLEPWGPEASQDPFLAPDTVAGVAGPAGPAGGRPVVSPLGTADLTWDALCGEHPNLRAWCRARWLADLGPLGDPPEGLAAAVHAMHQVAQHVLAPWRYRAQGRIGLRWTLGGFGTPFALGDAQVRVADGLLVRQGGGTAEAATPATLGEVAGWLGVPLGAPAEVFTPEEPADPDEPVVLAPAAAAWVGEWFGFATRVLEEIRVGEADYARRRVQLWPEHFDVAVELGAGAARGTFGASAGDADHDGPYLYVTEWEKGRLPAGGRRDPAFAGVSLPVAEVLRAPEQLDTARRFYEHHRMLLERGGGRG